MIHKVFLLRKVVRQQGVTALLLYQAQTVAFRPQRLWIPKKTVGSLFLILRLTYCAGRWQSTSWLCYCLTKSRTEVLETIAQSALRRMWIVRNIPEYALLAQGATPWCSDSPYAEISPNTFLKHPVENRGVFGYNKRKRNWRKII